MDGRAVALPAEMTEFLFPPCNVPADGCDGVFLFLSCKKILISTIIAVPPRGTRSLVPVSSCRDPERGQAVSHRDGTNVSVLQLSGAIGICVTLSPAPGESTPKQGQNSYSPSWRVFEQTSPCRRGPGGCGVEDNPQHSHGPPTPPLRAPS